MDFVLSDETKLQSMTQSALLFLLFHLLVSPVWGALVQPQFDALEAFYIQTNGINWTYGAQYTGTMAGVVQWDFENTTSDPCVDHWSGVYCFNASGLVCTGVEDCYVGELILEYYDLRGTLNDDQFAELQTLNVLDFSHNELYGTIPSSISSLGALQSLLLYQNYFNGSISESIFTGDNLPKLMILSLDLNVLTGSIPTTIGDMTSLQVIGIHHNMLTGVLPSSMANLKNLEALSLDINSIGGPIPEFLNGQNFRNLTLLSMSNNRFSGSLPSSLASLSNLTILYLSSNKLTGEIPQSFSSLKLLQYLSLANNKQGRSPGLSGSLPDFLWTLTRLAYLRLQNNSFVGKLSSSVGNLFQLNNLKLANNYLTGTIPSSLGLLSSLTKLHLNTNQFTSTLPTNFEGLTSLEELFLEKNAFEGPLIIPRSINLTQINFNSNFFTGPIPSQLFIDSSKLETFAASKNCLSPYIPEEVCVSPKLTSLGVSGLQQAEGCKTRREQKFASVGVTIPECILQMSSLESLYMLGNGYFADLTDKVNLPRIRNFIIGSNNFIGNLNSNWTILRDDHVLDSFDISRNKLYGTMEDLSIHPTDETNPQNYFDTGENRLSGKIDMDAVSKYSRGTVSVLQGNVIDCETIPTYDRHYKNYEYKCQTSQLQYSFWVCTAIVGVAGLVIMMVCTIGRNSTTSDDKNFNDNFIQEIYTYVVEMLTYVDPSENLFTDGLFNTGLLTVNLTKLLRFITYFALLTMISTTILYLSLKSNPSVDTYMAYEHQYWNLPSGIWLKSRLAAWLLCMLFILFNIFLCKINYEMGHHRHAKIKTELHKSSIASRESWRNDEEPVARSTSIYTILHSTAIYFALFLYFSLYLLTNTLFAYYSVDLTETQQVCFRFAVVFLNLCMSFASPLFVCWLFPSTMGPEDSSMYKSIGESRRADANSNRETSISAALCYAILQNLVDVLIPLVASLIADPSCFQGYVFPINPVTFSYNYYDCDIYSPVVATTDVTQTVSLIQDPSNIVCYSQRELTSSITIKPPFTYSGHCRDGFYDRYTPIILLLGTIRAFLWPTIHMYTTAGAKSMYSTINLFGFVLPWGDSMMPNVTFALILILEDLALLLMYGVVSFYCTIALLLSAFSQIIMLRGYIHRACKYQLWQREKYHDRMMEGLAGNSIEKMKYDAAHISLVRNKLSPEDLQKIREMLVKFEINVADCGSIVKALKSRANHFFSPTSSSTKEVESDFKPHEECKDIISAVPGVLEPKSQQDDLYYIDKMCEDALKNCQRLSGVQIFLVAALYGLYLFDMALEIGDEKSDDNYDQRVYQAFLLLFLPSSTLTVLMIIEWRLNVGDKLFTLLRDTFRSSMQNVLLTSRRSLELMSDQIQGFSASSPMHHNEDGL